MTDRARLAMVATLMCPSILNISIIANTTLIYGLYICRYGLPLEDSVFGFELLIILNRNISIQSCPTT